MTGPMQLPATWDAVAPGYAVDAVAFFTPYAEAALRLAPVTSKDRVLDVACGPGTLAFLAARRAARVDAVDFSPGMVEEVRARAARDGVKNIESSVMDAQALTYPDRTFDVGFCLFAYMFFPDRAHAFRELVRVLRPGGRACIATWAPIEHRPFMKVGFDALAEAIPDVPTPAKDELQHPAECIAEMTAGGFTDVQTLTVTTSVPIASAEQYVQIMERTGAPLPVLRNKLGPEAWAAAVERLTAAVRRRLGDLPTDLSTEAILTSGARG